MSKKSAGFNIFGSRYLAKRWADKHNIEDYVICRTNGIGINGNLRPIYKIYANIEPGEIDRIVKIIMEGNDHD